MESKLINNLGEKIDSFATDETQRKAVRISILFTGVLWIVLLMILGFAPTFQKKEKYILTERFIIGKTQVELANELGISQAQISRLEKSGIDSLKKQIN